MIKKQRGINRSPRDNNNNYNNSNNDNKSQCHFIPNKGKPQHGKQALGYLKETITHPSNEKIPHFTAIKLSIRVNRYKETPDIIINWSERIDRRIVQFYIWPLLTLPCEKKS